MLKPLTAVILGLLSCVAECCRAEDAIPNEVAALVGTYAGSWTMFGIDDKDEIVKRMSWTDKIKAEKPQAKDGRAFVKTTGEMVFEGGRIPPVKMQGEEGFYLRKDGTIGDAFVEMAGHAHRMTKLSDNVWSYSATATPQELAQLGFKSAISGQHVLVKVITTEDKIETHRISRLTTVQWKDKDGKERAMQFVSLQGHHKRQPKE
jgi:hypothetical protein